MRTRLCDRLGIDVPIVQAPVGRASGAWMGTRFLVSEEASVPPRYRELRLQGNKNDTVHSTLFNIGWPDGVESRNRARKEAA